MRVTAHQEEGEIVFRSAVSAILVMRITSEDLGKLSKDDWVYIGVREKLMRATVKEWSELYPKRVECSDDKQRASAERLRRLVTEICKDRKRT